MEDPRISQGEVPVEDSSSQPNPTALDRPSLPLPGRTELPLSTPLPPRPYNQRRQHHQQQLQQRHHQSYLQHVAPLDSLVRKLSQQSLRPQIRQRTPSRRSPGPSDLSRAPTCSDTRPPVSSNVDGLAMEVDPEEQPDYDLLAAGNTSYQVTPQRRDNGPIDTLHANLALHAAVMTSGGHMREEQYYSTIMSQPIVADKEHAPLEVDATGPEVDLTPDEGYCEGEDDFSWMEEYPMLGADVSGTMRSNGILRWRTSSETALRCPKVVRHVPRMRKRTQQKRDHRMRASTMPNATIPTLDTTSHITCT